ncbi:bifunctional riboflavin kinase/FAD synthetase [Beijerinckia indica]|uniref:Riboflavin biosynthesis protein n=1 Tax=Beijerinckia indica subsp. indica (strain ATCC 9039 / DSM 1715 / NCIMB 8712) TaxID=395963 RepID=B2IK35_BEII9|nr:bifunctional riboflavin kinase/FAD synthetase [Beijerinckia indica]ACB94967.1 riboflavin biosynthesis protein RibF [Beijerinckia indica subsp. indica ATCC 9039]
MTDSPAQKPFILAVDPQEPPAGLAGAVIAIGNFDGVHRGHLAVIKRAEALAARLGRPCAVLTFEPHPTDYFSGDHSVFRLTPLKDKAKTLERLGLDGMIVIPFNAGLASLAAEDFVTEILLRRLAVSAVVAGYDFHFGAGRKGTPDFLKQAGQRHGFEVEIVERIASDAENSTEAASSTGTRLALETGDVDHATHLLGHPYTITGEVLHGQELGRQLGFPTANLRPDPSCRLRHGVYAVRALIEGEVPERMHEGVANYGRRPTVDHGAPLLEIFLLDFTGDLYSKIVEVFFIGFIRGEEKFASLDALKAQIAKDVESARAILKKHS